MRHILFILSVFWTSLISAQVDTVNDKWLLILTGFENLEQAQQAKQTYNFETVILNSGDYDNLNSGWFINCIPFDTKNNAESESKRLKDTGFNNYIKYSGKFKNSDSYLVDNHFLIFDGQYIITDYKIQKDKISSIIGCDKGGTFVAKASVSPDSLPASLRYLIGKEMVVYDINGKESFAKINEIIAVNISNPYWGYVVQWQQENTSEVEIAKQLIDMGQLTLVATIDLPKDFSGVLSHLKTDCNFSMNDSFDNYDIINQAYQTIDKHKIISKCDSLLDKSMKEDNAYKYYKKIPIDKQAKGIKIGGTNYVFLNIIYGDYCDYQKYGHFYFNIFAIWNEKTDSIEILDRFQEASKFNYIPFSITKDNNHIIGFIDYNYGGIATYFKYPDWKNIKALGIWTHECD